MDDETMFTRVDHDDERTMLLAGEVDLAVRDELQEQVDRLVADEPGATVVVGLAAVTFLDSSALGVLVTARKHADEHGVELVLDSPSAPVRRVLEISGLDQVFTVRDA